MPWRALLFAFGVWAVQQLAVLPAPTFFGLAGALGLSLLLLAQRLNALPSASVQTTGTGLLAALLMGLAWAGAWAHWRLADALPTAWEGRDVELVGTISGLPQRVERGVRFVLDVEESSAPLPGRLALSWYHPFRPVTAPDDAEIQDESQDENQDESQKENQLGAEAAGSEERNAANNKTATLPPLPRAGERWRLLVRLKRPHGSLNPHGYDIEAAWFERGIRATGYVKKSTPARRLNQRLGRASGPAAQLDEWREAARTRLLQVIGEQPYGGVLVALAIGDQQAIAPELWRLFAATGITHLMSISGLHVTMLGALVGWAVFGLWRRSARLPLLWPAQKAAALAALLGALGYALLAGFGIPAQRTLFMLAIVVAALLSGRALSLGQVLGTALVGVLLLDPWAVLAAGFWLSFAAVALLFYAATEPPFQSSRPMPQQAVRHWLGAWLRAQWAITLGLMPLLLALFQQFSLVSPLANAVAIPLVSMAIAPLALLGLLPGFGWAIDVAYFLLAPLLDGLHWLAQLPGALWQQHAPPAWAVPLALVGVLLLLLPAQRVLRAPPWLMRLGGVLLCLPLFLILPSRPPSGEARITVLDVGQGQALHVQTATHDLLYDSGPNYGTSGVDAGSRVILPYLRAVGVRQLDMLLLSHADSDHAGGAESVLASLPVARLLGSLSEKSAVARRQERCHDGQHWEWDGVRFDVLHPTAQDYAEKRPTNAMSCVLKIEAVGASALLPGDIEGKAEAALLARHDAATLKADLLLAPHHGGRHISSAAFIAAVGAHTVVFPVGYRNRFGHPVPAVVERYTASGAQILRTDHDGAVAVQLRAEASIPRLERGASGRYWQRRETPQ